MPILPCKLHTITPWFLNGSDPRSPEVRAASVRGQLRYWLRAIEGARGADLAQLWKRESNVFGSTGGSSSVSLRLYPERREELLIEKYAMLPHKKDEKERSPQYAIKPDQFLRLEVVTRPGVKPSSYFRYALEVWLLLGGIGKRSRRMFGALGDSSFWFFESLSGPEDLAKKAKEWLAEIIKQPGPRPDIPLFPTLHPDHSWIVIGKRGESDWETMIRALFTNLLRTPKYIPHDERSFGYMGGRRASPLIAQVRKIGDRYYPVLTVMRSKPDKDIKWHVLNDFMNDAAKQWDGITVWGGPLK